MKFFLDLKGQSMSDVTGGATDNITLENYSEKLGFETVIPAFIVSELKRAFQMGFLIFYTVPCYRPCSNVDAYGTGAMSRCRR